MASAGPSAQGGSYFGLNLSSESAASAAPAAAAGTTPFFTPSAYPATPNPFGRPDQTHADNNNAGFAAALQRNNTLTLPSAKKPAPATTRVSPSQAGPSTPSVSAVNAAPSASSGATPFFSDLSLHSGHHQQQQQNQQESPKHQNHHHPHAALLRRTSSASAVPNPSAPPSLSLPALKMPSAGVNGNKRPSTASGAGASESASFPALAPADVQPSWFLDERQSTLVLDLRTHSAFLNHGTGRLRGSVNLCVPTTLLRRPNHSLTKLADTLPDKHHRDALLDVLNPDTPLKRVIALDQDSVVLAPSGPLCSILSKVARERGQAAAQQTKNNVPALQLFWVKGGMCALAKDSKVQRAGVLIPPGTEDDSDSHSNSEDSLSSLARTDSDASDRSSSSGTSVHSSDSGKSAKSADTATTTVPPILQVRSLPMAAFDNTSTQQYKNNGPPTSSARPASRQQPGTPGRRMAANPFFDAIRQNREVVDLETSLRNVPPLPLSPKIERASESMPPFLKSLIESTPKQRAERLAAEYHELETLEQRRLTQLMEWHSSPQSSSTASHNPLSISAGVEKGHLNRYRHIFPFEHTRCRLQNHASSETDYINASHIRFRSSKKHYIASQGPLAAATSDFWQLVWQENVTTVVMLTHLREGGLEKCHKYFDDGTYGHLRVTCTHSDEAASQGGAQQENKQDQQQQNEQGSFFSTFDLNRTSGGNGSESPESLTRRRTLTLENLSRGGAAPPRKVQHFQFGNWPDFDIPPDSETLLSFIREVNQTNRRLSAENGLSKPAPVLVHCSAGVGRTGCFMLIDTLLDRLEHVSNGTPSVNLDLEPSAMDLDEPHVAPPQAGHSGFDDRPTPPLLRPGPVFAAVNEMREQRMSMVANLAQYQFIHTAVMHGLSRSLSTPTKEHSHRHQQQQQSH